MPHFNTFVTRKKNKKSFDEVFKLQHENQLKFVIWREKKPNVLFFSISVDIEIYHNIDVNIKGKF